MSAENTLDLRKQIGVSKDDIIHDMRVMAHVKSDAPRAKLEEIERFTGGALPRSGSGHEGTAIGDEATDVYMISTGTFRTPFKLRTSIGLGMPTQQRLEQPAVTITGDDALLFLQKTDQVMAALIEAIGPFRPALQADPWETLASAVIYQQLSGQAAKRIRRRICNASEGYFPRPPAVLRKPKGWLRGFGLTLRKEATILDLASLVVSQELDFERLRSMHDDEVQATLTAVRGVGPWTASMFMVFHQGRRDILMPGDLGLRNAIRVNYGWRGLPSQREVKQHGERWAPYRTIASWYLWKSLPGFPEPGF